MALGRSKPTALCLLAGLLLASSAAHGANPLADQLFEEGKKAFDAGNYPEACAKLKESMNAERRLGTLLNLARCHKFEGKIATAWSEFKEAEAWANKSNEPDRAKAAADFAAELEPLLSRLTIDAPDAPPGFTVRVNDAEMATGGLGVALPQDPGEVHIAASAPGYKTYETTITLGENADSQTVTIPPLEEAPEEAGVTGPAGGPASGSSDGGDDTLMTAGFIVGGVGVVGIGLGAIFGLVASGTASGAEDDPALCPNKQCTPAGREEIDSAETSATISTIGFGVGIAALAAGVVMVVIGSGGDETVGSEEPGVWISAGPTDGGGAVGLVGRF